LVGVGIVVDPRAVTSGSVSQNSSVASRRLALLNEVTMSIIIVVVGSCLLVVRRTHVMRQLVAKAVIAKGTALLSDGESIS